VFYVLEGDEPDFGEDLLQALPLSNAVQAEGDAADLDEIQRDISDLLEIQSNLNRLVHGQGKDIDLIEANVGVAHMRVSRGQRVLGEAAVLRGSSRRKKCCIALCVLVAIAVPVIILAILIPTLVHILSSS
jgi:t-SNARE complex subunit (syntaxin)